MQAQNLEGSDLGGEDEARIVDDAAAAQGAEGAPRSTVASSTIGSGLGDRNAPTAGGVIDPPNTGGIGSSSDAPRAPREPTRADAGSGTSAADWTRFDELGSFAFDHRFSCSTRPT